MIDDKLAFEQLGEINKGNDVSLKVHEFIYVATASPHGRWLKISREYLTKTPITLNVTKPWCILDTRRPSGLTLNDHERLAMLSQAIYLEHYLFLVVDELKPKEMTTRIEKEFRHELQVRLHSIALRDVD